MPIRVLNIVKGLGPGSAEQLLPLCLGADHSGERLDVLKLELHDEGLPVASERAPK